MKLPLRDAGIPVLTEIIAVPVPPPADDSLLLPPAADADDTIDVPAAAAPLAAGAVPVSASILSADDFDHLVNEVRAHVLAQLQSRYDSLLGERIRARLVETLESVAVDIADQIKSELLHEMEDLVAITSHRHIEDEIFNKK